MSIINGSNTVNGYSAETKHEMNVYYDGLPPELRARLQQAPEDQDAGLVFRAWRRGVSIEDLLEQFDEFHAELRAEHRAMVAALDFKNFRQALIDAARKVR